MPREVFVAGQILTAAEMNIVSDQTVMTFAGTAARGSAIPTPSEGMAAYLSDSNIVSLYDGAAWKNSLGVTGGILQVVSTTKTDTFSTSAAAFTDITGLSVTITPKSTSSRILVFGTVAGASNAAGTPRVPIRLLRDATAISIGDTAGSRTRTTASGTSTNATVIASIAFNFVDSPATTSATTYKLQTFGIDSTTVVINRSTTDTDNANFERATSTITVMEVAG